MFYVYILQSIHYPEKKYIGRTANVLQRLQDHNAGTTTYTKHYRPWHILVFIAFKNQTTAIKFESYLKTASGRAFANKRLL